MKSYALAAIAAVLLSSTAAHAVQITFSGGDAGFDPLGQPWRTGGVVWGEPNDDGAAFFNTAGLSTGGRTWANSLMVVFDPGVGGGIDADESTSFHSRLRDATTGETWTNEYVGDNQIIYRAPTGSRINAGDLFFVETIFNDEFTEDDLKSFHFTATWDDGVRSGVPEPASWALMLCGFGAAGAALRHRRNLLAAA